MCARLLSLIAAVALIAPAAGVTGQTASGHVYWVGFYQALPGKAAAYNKALSDIADPVLDELVRRKLMVSHVQLVQHSGAGENTNLVILEFPSVQRAQEWFASEQYAPARSVRKSRA